METVEVVIRIPEKYIEGSLFNGIEKIMKAVRAGTVLPKGHGRLIDADVLNSKIIYEVNMLNAQACYDSIEESLRIAPTIIEADKEVANG